MEVRFERRDDGQVDAFLPAEHSLMNEALNDAISSLPPRGMPGNGPSTYWIDVAEKGARQAAASGDERPFTGGNVTQMRFASGQVEAMYDYDDELVERMRLSALLPTAPCGVGAVRRGVEGRASSRGLVGWPFRRATGATD